MDGWSVDGWIGGRMVGCSMVDKCLVLAELVDKKKMSMPSAQQLGEIFVKTSSW